MSANDELKNFYIKFLSSDSALIAHHFLANFASDGEMRRTSICDLAAGGTIASSTAVLASSGNPPLLNSTRTSAGCNDSTSERGPKSSTLTAGVSSFPP